MMIFCYLYITNDDVFAKCSFVLICNVNFSIFIILTLENIIYFIICNLLFAKFIKTQIFCTLHVMCAILFLHIWWCMCNFVTMIVIFCTRRSLCAVLFLHTYNAVCNISKSITFCII